MDPEDTKKKVQNRIPSAHIYFGPNMIFLSLTVSSYFNITHILVYFPKQHYFSLKIYNKYLMFGIDFLCCHNFMLYKCPMPKVIPYLS